LLQVKKFRKGKIDSLEFLDDNSRGGKKKGPHDKKGNQ
jgi:hypothetical protein